MPVLETAESKKLDELIFSIAQGDKSALAELYRIAGKSVYTYSLSLVRDRHETKDVLQDTMLEIIRSSQNYKSMGKPIAWIITIARAQCMARLRQRSKFSQEPFDELVVDIAADPGFSFEDSEIIKTCLGALGEVEREVVVLHAVAGLRHREIAEIIGLSLPTVLSKYSRAIKKLQIILKGAL